MIDPPMRAQVERSRGIVDAAGSLDTLSEKPVGEDEDGTPAHASLRYILVHLVEEYARHAGHADLIAEAIDGRVGE